MLHHLWSHQMWQTPPFCFSNRLLFSFFALIHKKTATKCIFVLVFTTLTIDSLNSIHMLVFHSSIEWCISCFILRLTFLANNFRKHLFALCVYPVGCNRLLNISNIIISSVLLYYLLFFFFIYLLENFHIIRHPSTGSWMPRNIYTNKFFFDFFVHFWNLLLVRIKLQHLKITRKKKPMVLRAFKIFIKKEQRA